MAVRDYLPFIGLERSRNTPVPKVDENDIKAVPKLFKAIGLAVGYTGGTYSIGFNRVNFEPAPYDLNRIIMALDTDSYLKQGFNKYKELLWKEGYTLVSENPQAVEYLNMRIQFMELSMKRSFQSFLVDVADQLIKFGNAFIVKVRGDLNPFFPGQTLHGINASNPVVGYELLPAETVEIMRDWHNKPLKYRQNIWGANGYNAPSGFGRGNQGQDKLLPTWNPTEVIHFVVDQKPGRLFGTPFIVSALDDVIALRQVEEDAQNLVHRELFPLYKYMVGTEDHPAEPDEIQRAAEELAGLRNEGGLVLPDRHDVEVIGSEGSSLDISTYLAHFKERVAIGIGMTKKILGMEDKAGGADETVDSALYDKIKFYQRYFADVMRLGIFNELLLEGDFDPFAPKGGKLDTTYFIFHEIDVDTQVKKENHIVQKWISDLMTWEETRIALKQPLDADRQELYTSITNNELAPPAAPGKPIKPGAGTPAWSVNKSGANPNAKASGGAPPTSSGGVSVNKNAGATRGGSNNAPKLTGPPAISKSPFTNPRTKSVANKSMPTNQFGTRTSSNIKHSDDEYINEIQELLREDDDV